MKRFLGVLGFTVLALTSYAQFYGYKEEPMIGQSRVAVNAASAGVRVDQNIGKYVDGNLTFTDDHGEQVKFGDLSHGKPIVLLPIFYQCPGVCTNELDQLVRTLQGFKKDNVGQSFEVIVLSIDHSETAKMAAAKKDMYVDYYEHHHDFNEGGRAPVVPGRDQSQDGWHFLVGSEDNIQALTKSIGFNFTRDKANGNIVHPAALVVLTPNLMVSRYYLTTEYPQQILLDSIRKAGLEQKGEVDQRPFYLACIHIDPLTGQRSLNVLNAVKTAGLATLAVLIFSIIAMGFKEKKRPKE